MEHNNLEELRKARTALQSKPTVKPPAATVTANVTSQLSNGAIVSEDVECKVAIRVRSKRNHNEDPYNFVLSQGLPENQSEMLKAYIKHTVVTRKQIKVIVQEEKDARKQLQDLKKEAHLAQACSLNASGCCQ